MDGGLSLNYSRENLSLPSSSWTPSSIGPNSSYSSASFSGLDLLFVLKPLFIPLYSATVMVSCCGNLLLLALMRLNKKKHNTTNFLIGNLAFVDLIMCIFCVPLTASYAFDVSGWIFGWFMCHFVMIMQSVTVYASVLSLMAIAVDRYVVVAHPTRKRAGHQFCWCLVVLIWLSSLVLSTPTALHTGYLDLRATGVQMAICEEFWLGEEHSRLIYSCFILFFSYIVPLAAVSISYCAISYQLRQRTISGLMAATAQRCGQATWNRRRRKTFCLLLVSALCFAFSWLPLQVVNLIRDLDTDFSILGKDYINIIQVSCHLFAMSSTCYNPFIYASLHDKVLPRLSNHFLMWWRRRGRGRGVRHGSSVIMTLSHRLTQRHTSTTVQACRDPPQPGLELTDPIILLR